MDRINKQIDRVFYLDFLRVAAIFVVIVLHTAESKITIVEPNSFEWMVFNLYDGFVRWAVPVLVMISGVLFLDEKKKISLSTLHSKYIRRIVIAFSFWSSAYAFVNLAYGYEGMFSFFADFVKGHYHLWFLFMIVGLYLGTPIFRQITRSKAYTKYFLSLSILFTFIVPTILSAARVGDNLALGGMHYSLEDFGQEVVGNVKFYFTLVYVAYFIGGYYLSKLDISPKAEICIYIGGIIGYLITVSTASIATSYLGYHYDFYGNNQICVMLESIAVFTFAKCRVSRWLKNDKAHRFLVAMSKYSFGIYLIHAMILEGFTRHIFDTTAFNPIISVPTIVIIVFVVSTIASATANRIPLVKKYIV